LIKEISKPLTLGVDVGGTKINLVVIDFEGHILYNHKSLHASTEPKRIIEDIMAGLELCLEEVGQEVKAVGIGVAGQIDSNGVVLGSPNLGWKNFPFKKELEKKLALPLLITNDVMAAAWSEWQHGSGQGTNDMVVIFVGTGVGGGVISGGKILSGCTNSGGELGHITIVSDGRKCRCHNNGCLEAYVGGWAIAERAKEAIQANPESGKKLLSLAGNLENVTAATVAKAFHESDPLSRLLVEKTGQYLASGVVSVINAFNPCILILGGNVIEGIPELVQIVKEIIPTKALEAALGKLKIVNAKLGGNAGALGAAFLAQELAIKIA
jgi:glucokinase